MSAIVKEALAAELAQLTPVVAHPVAPFGYGSDISGADDLDPNMAEVDGSSTLALAQAIVRRLDCPAGALPDDEDHGIDLRSYCNRGVTAQAVRALAGRIRNELSKDDRIASVNVTVRPSNAGKTLGVELAVQAVDPAIGGFSLTLSASSASVLLEEIRAAA